MTSDSCMTAHRPAHVPEGRLVDFDIYAPIVDDLDFQQSWRAFRQSVQHDLIWTPRNEGHWIALDGELIREIMADAARFSSHTVLVPKETAGVAYRLLPLSLDPPEHTPFRDLLNESLSPKHIRPLVPEVRALTVELIESFHGKGRCNFALEFSQVLPIRTFMRLVDLPMSDFPQLKHLADQFTRPDGSLTYPEVVQHFHAYIGPLISNRRKGKGDDLLSRLARGEVNGRPLTDLELANITMQLLVAGLDTVVNFMSFVMLFLARNADVRRRIAGDPAEISNAIAELLRRFPLVADGREVRHDVEVNGVSLKAGEMIVAPTVLYNMDDRINPDPERFDLDREGGRHCSFGQGSHFCPGSALAHMEIQLLLEEWLRRIPDFTVAPDTPVRYVGGIVGSVEPYDLIW